MPLKSSYYGNGETYLQNLFSYFSYFAFDKAKEQADKERDISKNQTSPVWVTLLSSISQLASVEKLYMNLTFLTPKGFLRKESSVRLTYESILSELVESEKRRTVWAYTNLSCGSFKSSSHGASKNHLSSDGHGEACSEGVLLHISSHVVLFIQARLLMLSFYEKLISSSGNKYIDYEEMLLYINDIISKNCSSFHHPVLAPVKTTFTYESEITSHLLGALKSMQQWQFLPSLLHLHDAHSKLNSWQTLIQSKESKKYGFGSAFLKSSSLPALYQWLWTAKASFVSKFSLYFYDVLSIQAPLPETKGVLAKLSCDYVSKIQSFQRRSEASSVSFILSSTSRFITRNAGYAFPDSRTETPTGVVETFPVIYSFPVKPDQHLPTIIMQISNRSFEDVPDKVFVFHDSKVAASYYFCMIELNIFGVAIFESKRPEKESLVKDFLLEIAVQLRCSKIFSALKPN